MLYKCNFSVKVHSVDSCLNNLRNMRILHILVDLVGELELKERNVILINEDT